MCDFELIVKDIHKYLLQFCTDEAVISVCVYIYIYITFYTLQNLIFREPDFLFVTIHFKVYTYILNYLCFWFLLFICHFFWRKKRGGGIFYSHKYIRMIFRLNFQLFSLYPRAVISLLKKEGEKTKGYNRI